MVSSHSSPHPDGRVRNRGKAGPPGRRDGVWGPQGAGMAPKSLEDSPEPALPSASSQLPGCGSVPPLLHSHPMLGEEGGVQACGARGARHWQHWAPPSSRGLPNFPACLLSQTSPWHRGEPAGGAGAGWHGRALRARALALHSEQKPKALVTSCLWQPIRHLQILGTQVA